MSSEPIATVLARYGLGNASARKIETGLINHTYRVEAPEGRIYALQRINPRFPETVNENIDAVTSFLESCSIPTPRLQHTLEGQLFVRHEDATWRLLTWMEGEVHTSLIAPEFAVQAGKLLARFHMAVARLPRAIDGLRPGVHDFAAHLENLERALAGAGHGADQARISALGRDILAAATRVPELPETPLRQVHGDPKISNVIYVRGTSRALCLIDLDTVSRMPLGLELGDAFRSWCNPAGEDTRETSFSVELFEAAISGYAQTAGDWVSKAEQHSLVPATERIYLELAARFCADALLENYFGWDPHRFASHREHSEVRAAGQFAAACSVKAQRPLLESIVRRSFS